MSNAFYILIGFLTDTRSHEHTMLNEYDLIDVVKLYHGAIEDILREVHSLIVSLEAMNHLVQN